VPSGLLNFPSIVPGVTPHNWQAGVTPTSSIAHKGEVAGAKVLAASILDLLTSPEILQKANAEFQEATKDSKYFSLMPAEAKPPLEMNREMMEKYRPQMRKYYLNKTPKFN
jgi:aminobenzoyl-glutamate utilization protein B